MCTCLHQLQVHSRWPVVLYSSAADRDTWTRWTFTFVCTFTFIFIIRYLVSSLSNVCNGLYMLMYYLENTLSPGHFRILLICVVSEMKFYCETLLKGE